MGNIRTLGRVAWRKWVIDGVSASGPNKPSADEIFAFVDRVDADVVAASAGLVSVETWSALNAISGTREAQPGRVAASDGGTHTDPVVGGTVPNSGEYRWSTSPAGWLRLSALVDVASTIHDSNAKTSPVDADEIGLIDSAASNVLKKISWSNLKASMFSAWGALIAAGTAKATPVDADTFAYADSAATNATKVLTWANLKTTLWAALGAGIHSATAQTTLQDGDELPVSNAAATYDIRRITWANIKAGMFSAWGALLAAGTSKTTPVDADSVALSDSAATNTTKKLTWANIKATLFASWGALVAAATTKSTPVDADSMALSDSASSNATKKLTWANLKATLWSSWGALIAAGTDKPTPTGADILAIADSAATNATKKLSLTNLRTWIAGAMPASVFTSTLKGSAAEFAISQSTSDASDNARTTLSGGGASGSGRGGYVDLYGNEHSGSPGKVRLVSGTNGNVEIVTNGTGTATYNGLEIGTLDDIEELGSPTTEEIVLPGYGPVTMYDEDPEGRTTMARTATGAMLVADRRGELISPIADPNDYDVVIYGGNIAGIMAAKRLSEYYVNGEDSTRLRAYRILVVEPTSHIGGASYNGIIYADLPSPAEEIPNALRGLTDKVFRDIGYYYDFTTVPAQPKQAFQPAVFYKMMQDIADECGFDVLVNSPLYGNTVRVQNNRITGFQTAKGFVRAKYFIDASYEGDLMAAAGVPWTIGRESAAEFSEDSAGFLISEASVKTGFLDNNIYLTVDEDEITLSEGDADTNVQPLTVRLPLTREANGIPFTPSASYDATRYKGHADLINGHVTGVAAMTTLFEMIGLNVVPSDAADAEVNFNSNQIQLFGPDFSNPLSREYICTLVRMNGSTPQWTNTSWPRRREIAQMVFDYVRDMFYFFQTDSSLPSAFRTDALRYRMMPFDYADSDNGAGFPHWLYIREGRRMARSDRLTQNEMIAGDIPGSLAFKWAYRADSHSILLIRDNDGTTITGEGRTGLDPGPIYGIPVRCLIPPTGSIENLVVPVCMAVTHVVQASVRMEPAYGMAGEVAGELIAQRLEWGGAVQNYDYDDLVERRARFGLTYDED